jgi:hypothetical protein
VLAVVEAVVMWVQDILDTLEEQSQVEIFQPQLGKLLPFQLATVVVEVQVVVVLQEVLAEPAHWAITVAAVETQVGRVFQAAEAVVVPLL